MRLQAGMPKESHQKSKIAKNDVPDRIPHFLLYLTFYSNALTTKPRPDSPSERISTICGSPEPSPVMCRPSVHFLRPIPTDIRNEPSPMIRPLLTCTARSHRDLLSTPATPPHATRVWYTLNDAPASCDAEGINVRGAIVRRALQDLRRCVGRRPA